MSKENKAITTKTEEKEEEGNEKGEEEEEKTGRLFPFILSGI